MQRLTNKRIIAVLFPILKVALEKVPKRFTKKDYYGHLYDKKVINNHTVCYTKWDDSYITVEVVMPLEGRYDHATVSAIIQNGKVTAYGYAKEFAGLGNGFYADLDENGNIIKSEWD